MESISLFINKPTPTQFLNKVKSCNTHSQSMVDSIATIFESIKNNVGSLFGYEPPLNDDELKVLASLVSAFTNPVESKIFNDRVTISLSDKTITITHESTSKSLEFKDKTELESFCTDCAKRYLRGSRAMESSAYSISESEYKILANQTNLTNGIYYTNDKKYLQVIGGEKTELTLKNRSQDMSGYEKVGCIPGYKYSTLFEESPGTNAESRNAMHKFLIQHSTNLEDKISAAYSLMNTFDLTNKPKIEEIATQFNNLDKVSNPAEKILVIILRAKCNVNDKKIVNTCFSNLNTLFNSTGLSQQDKQLISYFMCHLDTYINHTADTKTAIADAAKFLLSHEPPSTLLMKKDILLNIIYTHGTDEDKTKYAHTVLSSFQPIFAQDKQYVHYWIKTNQSAWKWIKQPENAISGGNRTAALYNKINNIYDESHLLFAQAD